MISSADLSPAGMGFDDYSQCERNGMHKTKQHGKVNVTAEQKAQRKLQQRKLQRLSTWL